MAENIYKATSDGGNVVITKNDTHTFTVPVADWYVFRNMIADFSGIDGSEANCKGVGYVHPYPDDITADEIRAAGYETFETKGDYYRLKYGVESDQPVVRIAPVGFCEKCGSETHRDDAMNRRCNRCEHKVRQCDCEELHPHEMPKDHPYYSDEAHCIKCKEGK